ncbi:hypothetical protein O6H91_11G106400 [Diphasiastrum complanatum]|nr:hypothetical protein O6H91_11G106400 [Diphasiastrum complanatum]KAJ7539720.1 hypothetical protein O6H91_11G106400 [Diphasiastrum complanatum]
MASSYAASFYTKASNLVDHPPCSIFGSSVNNGSNGSSEYGATVAPESECGDPDGEAISKKYHNGSLEGKSKFLVDQEAESLSCEEVHYEDGQVVGSQLEAKDDEDVLPPEDANLCEIDTTQNTANVSFKFGLEGDGAFENKIQDTDLVSHEDKCDKKTDCTSMCSSLFNLQTSDLKMKSNAASNEKDPLEDVDQNYDHQTDENIQALEHDALGLSLVVGTAGIQRKCTGIPNPEDSKALDAIPYHIAEFAAELDLTIHQGVPNYFENQSSECQFEDKMDIDYYVPRQIKSKLRVESEEDCLEEQGDEILSSHAHCKTELLDPNCSNSSMEVYQFNERLELSRVETDVSSAYKQSSCLSHSTKLAYYRLEDCNSRDHQSGEQSEMVRPATRVQSMNLETVTAERLRGTLYDLEKAGMNDKLGPTQADRPLFSDKAQRGSPQESCSDSVSVESMIWQVKDNDDAPSNKNCCSCHLGLLGSQDSMNHTLVSRGDPTNGVLSRLSVETENSEHCKCLLNIRAERVPIEEENITAPAGYVEMLMYDSSSYAGTEDKECVDYHADALAQEKFCMNEPEKAFRCPPDSLIANKSAATVLMDECKGILSLTSGARKTDFMSGEKIVAIVHKDGTDSQADAVTGSEILQALHYRLRSFSSDSSGYTADSHVDNNCGFNLVRCKQDYLVEEEQSCSGVIVNQMEYLKACAEDISSLRCASDNLSSSSNSHEPVHEEDITMSEAVQPHKLNTAKEILQSFGEDFVVEKRIPACLGSTAKATETDTICSSIVHDLVSRAVALAAEKDELATFATPASMKELVTLLGASETKGKIHRELENREPGNLNGPNIGGGSTVRRTLTYMQNQKVMQSPTVAYLQSPVGKVKENMRDEDDSMLVAFEIDERDDAAIKTKHKCCCTIM